MICNGKRFFFVFHHVIFYFLISNKLFFLSISKKIYILFVVDFYGFGICFNQHFRQNRIADPSKRKVFKPRLYLIDKPCWKEASWNERKSSLSGSCHLRRCFSPTGRCTLICWFKITPLEATSCEVSFRLWIVILYKDIYALTLSP